MRRSAILGKLEPHSLSRDFFRRRRRADLALAELLEPDQLAKVLCNYGGRHAQGAPVAAIAGEWSKRYFIRRPVRLLNPGQYREAG
ncbi:conserved hypothetical protein [Agrobacterium fabrum str. J-07]|nr:conserved hypothetical protein [Agrobacterium fabrum str. J-07]